MTCDLAAEFPLREGLIYLNHAGVSPWPLSTSQAVQRFAEENCREGSWHYPEWVQLESRLRERLRWLINAESADDIALLKSTSEGLSLVAYGLDWSAGDNVVIPDQEFPSNRVVWESLARYGVETRLVDLGSAETPEDAILARVDKNTRLISVSGVQYATGLRLDLVKLGRFCRNNGVLYCVDAIQWLGVLPFDLQEIQADFVAADGHKWMMGPEGIALFYCRPELRERLKLRQYGWHMVENMGDYSRNDWQPAASARRFECGSPNMLGIHGLEASLALIQEVGLENITRSVIRNISQLIDRSSIYESLSLVTPEDEARRAGIVTFRHRNADPVALHRFLMQERVLCAQRAGGIRFSPHFYNRPEELERALDLLGRFS